MELALGLTEASKKKARKVAKKLIGQSGATAAQLQGIAEELLSTGLANREALVKIIRFEVDRTLGKVGLATAEEVAELNARVSELQRKLREAEERLAAWDAADSPQPPAPQQAPGGAEHVVSTGAAATEAAVVQDSAVAGKVVAKRTVAKKTVAKKTVAKKTVAKKAVVKKTAAKKVADQASPQESAMPESPRVEAKKLPPPPAQKAAKKAARKAAKRTAEKAGTDGTAEGEGTS